MIVNWDKVIEEDVPMYDRAMEKAIAFMKYKYPSICFCGLHVNLYSRKGGAYFDSWKEKGWTAKIHSRYKLYFYNRKSCGLTTPRGGIEVPLELDATITIIHELTHYAQALYSPVKNQRIKKGVVQKIWNHGTFTEIDTTKNSIEYLQMYHPEIYRKLIKTETDYPVPTYLEKLFDKINSPKEIEMENKEEVVVVEPKKEEVKPTPSKDEEKRNHILKLLKGWETKKKRADNAIKKLTKKAKYYDKKISHGKEK